MKRPVFPEAISFESCDHIEGLVGCMVVGLGFSGWDMSDRAEQVMVLEPVHPAQGRHFPPLTRSVLDDLGLVKAVDRLGQGALS